MKNAPAEKVKKTPKKNGGARPGAGRKKGGMNDRTRERLEALKLFKDRVAQHVNVLFDAQINLARGLAFMYRIDEEENSRGQMVKKHVLVTDPKEIQKALDEGLIDTDYYYITTEKPDNRAIDSLLDRGFGKPEQSVDLTSKGKEIAGVIALPAREIPTEQPAE